MPSKSNYICVKCELEMYPKRNEVFVEEHSEYDWPYKIWVADLWACPLCETEIIAGFAPMPLVESLDEETYLAFKEKVTHHIRETAALVLQHRREERIS